MLWKRSWNRWVWGFGGAYGAAYALAGDKPWRNSPDLTGAIGNIVIESIVGAAAGLMLVFVIMGIGTGLIQAYGDRRDRKVR